MLLRALSRFAGDINAAPGSTFECDAKRAKELIAGGFAEDITPAKPKRKKPAAQPADNPPTDAEE